MELGKLTAVFDADTRKFDSGVRGVATKIAGLDKSVGSLTGGAGSAAKALSGMVSPMALAAGGAVVAASAISGVAVGLWKLVTSSAEAGGELYDLSQKTNFAVETLSGLSIVAQNTGSDIKSISNSLFIYQSNMVKAKDETSAMGKAFKSLKVDTQDQEKSLRQAITALYEMGETEEQAAKAKLLFGKAGKDVLAVVKETNGNLDLAIAKYDKMGLIISTSAASASDKFNDVLKETELQLAAVTRTIGMELLPMATKALQDISRWLAANKNEWKAWGSAIASVTGEVLTHIGYIAKGLKSLMTLSPIEIQIIERVMRVDAVNQASQRSSALGTGVSALWWLATQSSGKPDVPTNWGALTGGAGGGRGPGSYGGGGGGGGRGGGGGGGGARQDPGIELLKQLQEQFKELTPRTELQRAQDKLLDDQYKKTTDSIKKRIMVTAIEIDMQKKTLELTRARFATDEMVMRQKAQEWRILDLVNMARNADLTRDRYVTPYGRSRPGWIDLGGGSTVGGEVGGSTRPRIATAEEQGRRDQLARLRDQMENLASDLTGIFDRALYDGISGGGLRGLQSLALGFLDLIQEVIMGQLKKALADALGGIGASSGGGGILSKILGTVLGLGLSAAGGGGGGGGTSSIPGIRNMANPFMRAGGGPVASSQSYVVGEQGPEVFVPNSSGHIVPNNKLGGTTVNHFNFTVHERRSTFRQNRSKRELSEMVAGLLAT